MRTYTFEPDRESNIILTAFWEVFGENKIPTNLHNATICDRSDLCVDIDAGDRIKKNANGTWTIIRRDRS